MSRESIQYHSAGDGAPELILCREEPRDYPWHFHARHWTYGLVRAGSVLVTTLQGVFPLGIGESFVIPPFAPHKLSISGHSSLAVLCSPDPGTVAGVTPLGEDEADNDLAAWLADPAAAPTLTVPAPPIEEASPVAAVRGLLAAQPDEQFPLGRLAGFAGCSPRQLLRIFKKETGLTPHAFQLICRVSRARAMLRAGTAAAETAVSAGFTDQSHLHKVFKLHHGLTPRQFTKAGVTPAR